MKNILILEDNQNIRDFLASHLSRHLENCHVLTAPDCGKGEYIMQCVMIHLVLADMDMSLSEGIQFLERVKKDYPNARLCVMMGSCSPSIQQRLRTIGVSRAIAKPFQLDALTGMIAEELAKAGSAGGNGAEHLPVQ
jgi:DNA-binding NtrC family response regulator